VEERSPALLLRSVGGGKGGAGALRRRRAEKKSDLKDVSTPPSCNGIKGSKFLNLENRGGGMLRDMTETEGKSGELKHKEERRGAN